MTIKKVAYARMKSAGLHVDEIIIRSIMLCGRARYQAGEVESDVIYATIPVVSTRLDGKPLR